MLKIAFYFNWFPYLMRLLICTHFPTLKRIIIFHSPFTADIFLDFMINMDFPRSFFFRFFDKIGLSICLTVRNISWWKYDYQKSAPQIHCQSSSQILKVVTKLHTFLKTKQIQLNAGCVNLSKIQYYFKKYVWNKYYLIGILNKIHIKWMKLKITNFSFIA
jgi:hypothetical protein